MNQWLTFVSEQKALLPRTNLYSLTLYFFSQLHPLLFWTLCLWTGWKLRIALCTVLYFGDLSSFPISKKDSNIPWQLASPLLQQCLNFTPYIFRTRTLCDLSKEPQRSTCPIALWSKTHLFLLCLSLPIFSYQFAPSFPFPAVFLFVFTNNSYISSLMGSFLGLFM